MAIGMWLTRDNTGTRDFNRCRLWKGETAPVLNVGVWRASGMDANLRLVDVCSPLECRELGHPLKPGEIKPVVFVHPERLRILEMVEDEVKLAGGVAAVFGEPPPGKVLVDAERLKALEWLEAACVEWFETKPYSHAETLALRKMQAARETLKVGPRRCPLTPLGTGP